MQRNKAIYAIAPQQCNEIKQRMLNWSRPFSILLFLDSNGYKDKYSRYECLLAVDNTQNIPVCQSLGSLRDFHKEHNDWLFGHINYDYKNVLEPRLSSKHKDSVAFPDFYFFCPQTVCYINTEKTELVIETLSPSPDEIYHAILAASPDGTGAIPKVVFEKRTTKETYLERVNKLRQHIKEGDCYEINYCNESYAENISINPADVYLALNALSRAPFAAYYRNSNRYLVCASPERYIQKQGSKIISQPIKGTARRDKDETQDILIKEQLYNSIKDRAENVMITDLVRNDLARSCNTGSIQVDELFGIYTFPQVHQMISTISGELNNERTFTDAIKYSFPMGSMTGAPKIKVMELIEQYEDTCRGLFSGTVGYITPDGDFDFNVVIRSLFYNADTQYLGYKAGGAITYDSDAEAEWEEMRLKAWALERIFAGAM